MLPINGRNDIVRDPKTGAVISVDSVGHKASVNSAKIRQANREKIEQNSADINSIKEELSEIKSMMRQLIGNIKDDGR